MSPTNQLLSPENIEFMSTRDLAEIAEGIGILPGDWVMIDVPAAYSQQAGPLRVWINPTPSNAIGLSFSFSKWNGIFLSAFATTKIMMMPRTKELRSAI